VPSRLDGRLRQSEEVLAILRAHYGAILCAPIRQNVRLSEAAAHGLTVHEYAPTSRGAADYAALARRVDSAAT